MALARAILQPTETRRIPVPVSLPPGRTVAAATAVTVQPRGLVAEVQPLAATLVGPAGTSVDVDLTGGTDGEIYLVAVTATSDAGETVEGELEVLVQDLAWTVPPDGSAAVTYIEPSDYVARYGLDETVKLTDEDDTGRIGREALFAALADAAAEIDAHLGVRYTVPLSPVPALIRTIAGDLARARLHRTQPTEAVALAAAEARRKLEKLAAGRMALAATPVRTDASSSPVVHAPERVFTRETLAGW